MKIILDTSTYSAFCTGDAKVVEILENAEEVIVPTSVAGELILGHLHTQGEFRR